MSAFANFFKSIQEQSARLFNRTLILIFLALLFFIAGGGISQNEKWRIVDIQVVGVSSIDADLVRQIASPMLAGNYFFVYAKANSYLFPRSEIEQKILDTFPRIAEVKVRRTSDSTIALEVIERKPYALWCGTKIEMADCWFIDENGFIFDKAPAFSKGVYREIYGNLIENRPGEILRASVPFARFSTSDSFTKLLSESIGNPFRVILKEGGESSIVIHTSTRYPFLSNTEIRFNDTSDPHELVKNLTAALPIQFPENSSIKKKLLYIDMRFGNRVVFGSEN